MLSVQQFLTQNDITPVPHPSYSSSLASNDIFFLFPQIKKVLKEKHFADVEEVKQTNTQKTAETLKGIKIDEFKNYLKQWEKVSIGVSHQMESALKVTEVKTCMNKYAIF